MTIHNMSIKHFFFSVSIFFIMTPSFAQDDNFDEYELYQNRERKIYERLLNADNNIPNSSAYLLNELRRYRSELSQNTNKTGADEYNGGWQPIGPFELRDESSSVVGLGRITCVQVHPTDKNIIWIGAATGGLWKSEDKGSTWQVNKDIDENFLSIGITDIVVNPKNIQVMYVATGDGDYGNSGVYSVGVLKSIDGGLTWNSTGLSYNIEDKKKITRLIINPDDPNILFAATYEDIQRTTNAGSNWSSVLSVGERVLDLEMKPDDPNIIYASTTTKVYKSITGGGLGSWVQLTSGLPTPGPTISRVVLAVTPNNSNVVYAMYSQNINGAYIKGVYKSINAGGAWVKGTNSTLSDAGMANVTSCISVSPFDENMVFIGGYGFYKSVDGANNFIQVTNQGIHVDEHDILFSSIDSGYVYIVHDGGIDVSPNNGVTWDNISKGLQILQIYEMAISEDDPNIIYVGTQDNGVFRYDGKYWDHLVGGDGNECYISQSSNDIAYLANNSSTIRKTKNKGLTFDYISPVGVSEYVGIITENHLNPSTIFASYYNDLWKSYNAGSTWELIADNLNGSREINDVKIWEGDTNIIWAAAYKNIYKSNDGGITWQEFNTSNGLPDLSGIITYLALHPGDSNKVWVTYSGYYGNRIYMTNNSGASWMPYSTGIPNAPVTSIIFEKNSPNSLYASTHIGVFYRDSTIGSWEPFMDGLPNVRVEELAIQYSTGKIIAGTHGRGVWESPLKPHTIPKANFYANKTFICPGDSITFLDISTNTPISWSWVFEGGTPMISNQRNPKVIYNTTGTFNVKLTISNNIGSDILEKQTYISVKENEKTIPIIENFDSDISVPSGWGLLNEDGFSFTTWEITDKAGKSGSNSVRINNRYYFGDMGSYDELTTTYFDLDSIMEPRLSFNYAYTTKIPANWSKSDTLKILVSKDCEPFQVIETLPGINLTTGIGTNNEFIPTAGQWKEKIIDMRQFAGYSFVQVKFQNKAGGNGNYLYLDDINITGTPIEGNNTPNNISSAYSDVSLDVYPNPTSSELTLSYRLLNDKSLKINLLDLLSGKKLINLVDKPMQSIGNYTISINLNQLNINLSPGLYFIELIADSDRIILPFSYSSY